MLQPVHPGWTIAQKAWAAAEREHVPLDENGPQLGRWLALISHAVVCHEGVPIQQLLEDYLTS